MENHEEITKQELVDTIDEVTSSLSRKVPTKDWKNIMERSIQMEETARKAFLSSNKYKFISVAASFLIVALISTALFAVYSGKGSTQVKTTDGKQKKANDQTTTTTAGDETTTTISPVETITTVAGTETTTTTKQQANPSCFKSLSASCGNVIQDWSFKTPTFSIGNYNVYGYSFSDNYPNNGIGVVFKVNASNIISSNTNVYENFKNTSACVQVQVKQDAGTPNSTIAGQTFTATMCEDTLQYFSYSGYGNDSDNWSSSCNGSEGADPRHGTWPQPTYKSTSFDQGGYFAGPKFVPGNYTVTIREMNASCTGHILAGPTLVTITN